MPLIYCPDCLGKGFKPGHANTGPDSTKHFVGRLPCFRCKETGKVPAQMRDWIEEGKQLRQKLIAKGETMLTASERFGVSPAKISAILCGRESSETLPGFVAWLENAD